MANLTKWSNTPKQFVGKLSTNCFSAFDHSVGLALKQIKGYIDVFMLSESKLDGSFSEGQFLF